MATYLETSHEDITFEFREKETLITKVKITNVSKSRIAFKIKTTNPKQFLVKPNRGEMVPNDAVEVEFQASPMQLAEAEKVVNSKFQIQAFPLNKETSLTEVEEAFKKMSDSRDQALQEIKLKCEMYIVQGERRVFISPKKPDVPNNNLYQSIIQQSAPVSKNTEARAATENDNVVKNITSLNQSSDQKKQFENLAAKYEELQARYKLTYEQRQNTFWEVADIRTRQNKTSRDINIKKILQLLLLGYLIGLVLSYGVN